MIVFHVFWNDKNRDCSINYVKDRGDVLIYNKEEVANFNFDNKLILQIDAESLSSKDSGKDLIIIDMGWKDALKLSKRFPSQLQRRSISGFKTAYPKTKPSSIRPTGGLRSIECMFVAKLILRGIKDESLLENYHFKDQFLEINKEQLQKIKRK